MIGRRASPSTLDADKPLGFDDFELRLGDIMRGERATLSKSLLDVQRELRIKASYIAAIENCDIAAFDTPGFVAGYVRSYARYLGLDPDWAFDRFCREANFTVAHGMSAAASGPLTASKRQKEYAEPLANPNASFVPQREAVFSGIQPAAIGSIFILVTLISGIGYGGWSVLQEVQRVQLAPVDQAPGVVAELDPLATAGGAMPQQTEADGVMIATLPSQDVEPDPDALNRLYRPQTLDVPVLVARDGPIAAIDPRLAKGQAATEAAPTVTTALGETPVQVVAAAAPNVELIAARPAWVRVQAVDGTVLFEGTMDAGDRYTIPAIAEAPLLRAGESGAVYFAVNGETFGPAGANGSVTKGIVLEPAALTERYAVADFAVDPDLARAVAFASAQTLTEDGA
ncbi:MAG: RodZ domain-containing protein, partial [Albidovulum sp.]